MISRSLFRRMLPISIHSLQLANSQNVNKISSKLLSINIAPCNILNVHILRTLSTQQDSHEANTTVNYDQVQKATTNNKVLIVDVREPDEVKEHGQIPNSINIPLGNITTVLGTMSENEFQKVYNRSKPTHDTEIIFYCMIGKRSGKAQQGAASLGFSNAKNYVGSWNDWASKKQS